jgi:hypothetical protein
LHQHLEIVSIGETPLDLPDIVAGQCAQRLGLGLYSYSHGECPFRLSFECNPDAKGDCTQNGAIREESISKGRLGGGG